MGCCLLISLFLHFLFCTDRLSLRCRVNVYAFVENDCEDDADKRYRHVEKQNVSRAVHAGDAGYKARSVQDGVVCNARGDHDYRGDDAAVPGEHLVCDRGDELEHAARREEADEEAADQTDRRNLNEENNGESNECAGRIYNRPVR